MRGVLRLAPVVIFWIASSSAQAACLIQVKLAGQDSAYFYAASQIDGLINADDALNRMSGVPKILRQPHEDMGNLMGNLTEALTTLELSARGFECAGSVVQAETLRGVTSNEFSSAQVEYAQFMSKVAHELYIALAKDTRAVAILFQKRLKGTIGEVDLAAEWAQISANIQDHLNGIMTTTSGISMILVDPTPDAQGHLSRLQITLKERSDLVNMIDKWFGKRAQSATDLDLPPLDAGATLLRNWLTTSGHKPRP
jgi:hypothetical protein